MTIWTARRSCAAPQALLFIVLMNTGAVAAFKWTSAHTRAIDTPARVAVTTGRVPVGGCGVVQPPAASISPAPPVPAPHTARVGAATASTSID